MLPNFFIVGAPKAGTTSLFHYLTGHPEVYMCPVKEPNYFSADDIQNQRLYYATHDVSNKKNYEALFENVYNEKAVGEASVSYLFYENVAAKIKKSAPKAKIIILLRDPATRGFSHYLMDSRLGYITLSFEEVIHKRSTHPLLDLYYQQVVELGLYFCQAKRYLDIFGPQRVKIFLNEDLKKDASSVMLSICEFLEIDPYILPGTKKYYNVYRRPRNSFVRRLYAVDSLRKIGRTVIPASLTNMIKNTLLIKEKKPELSWETRKYLVNFYKEDIRQLSNLIARDLSAWFLT